MAKPYTDPTTGEWVGEYETRQPDGTVNRDTEWFPTEQQARRFARTGPADTWPQVRDGITVWACCVSSIGPTCQHRTPPSEQDSTP